MNSALKAFVVLISIVMSLGQAHAAPKHDQTIFVFGGDINRKFVQYVAGLTGKPDPRIRFVPTASADNDENIKYWEFICTQLSIEPHVLRVWISSEHTTHTFEDILLGMDAIVVGGGNTLNMLGIWNAQGIDRIMKKALDKGIILAGGSAGSICWFDNGVSDSRPVELSVVDGLGFLPYSHCPHYGNDAKKEMYHRLVTDRSVKAGYACDDRAGLLFRNGKLVEAVSQDDISNSYYIQVKKGQLLSSKLESGILLAKGAIPEGSYTVSEPGKKLKDFPDRVSLDSPLDAYVSVLYNLANDRNSQYRELASHSLSQRLGDGPAEDTPPDNNRRNMFLDSAICRVLVYDDAVAGVIVKTYDDFYSIWYFYQEQGKWLNAGEDYGGPTVFAAEISFRERAEMHLENVAR